MEKFIVKETQNNMRLDKVLVAFMSDKSRNYISKLIDDGKCFVNDKVAKASLKVKPEDVISIDIPEDKPSSPSIKLIAFVIPIIQPIGRIYIYI